MSTTINKPPQLDPQRVQEFVIAAHGDLDGTKEMLAQEPALLNAVWDWGGGDFESAIGGAGHMGRRDIALYLIGQGARFDIFVAAMLGDLDLVRTMLTSYPHLLRSLGPHGIPLIAHAQRGGQQATSMVEYLEGLEVG
jgi:hypothetical protein